MNDMNEMDDLRFNYTTMPRRKEHPIEKYGNFVVRTASVKNDYGWHDFVFIYNFHYDKCKHAIFVSFLDRDNRARESITFPDHPDFDFLEMYITEF